MADIPKLKKKISAFLVSEEGKMSKESLIKTGAIIGAIALSSALAANNAAAGMPTYPIPITAIFWDIFKIS